jgi:hypothetical protein
MTLLPAIVQQVYEGQDMVFDVWRFESVERLEAGHRVKFTGPCTSTRMHVAPLLTAFNASTLPPRSDQTRYFHAQRAHFWNGTLIDFRSSTMLHEGDRDCPIRLVRSRNKTASLFVSRDIVMVWRRDAPFKKTCLEAETSRLGRGAFRPATILKWSTIAS